jgi:hypothetical protein
MRLSLRIFHRAGLAVLRHGNPDDAAGHIAPAKEVVGFVAAKHNAVTEAPAAVAEAHKANISTESMVMLTFLPVFILFFFFVQGELRMPRA